MMWEIVGLMHLLKAWRRTPDAPPSEYSCWYIYRDRHHPFTSKEITDKKNTLKGLSPAAYYSVFPEERRTGPDCHLTGEAGSGQPGNPP